jgi:hypothetical protein
MDKWTSIKKKLNSLSETGINPVQEGFGNYKSNIPEIEAKAKQRALKCASCPKMITEPVSFLAKKDVRFTEISNKICGICSCALVYLTRQNSKTCPVWDES